MFPQSEKCENHYICRHKKMIFNMDWMEIFTLVTGVAYIILEIRKKNLMWIVGIITSLAAMYMFWQGRLYASFGLNTYYFLISFWGLYQWRKDAAITCPESGTGEKDTLRLNRLTRTTVIVSLLVTLAGSAALILLLDFLEDPMSSLDAPVAVLSAVATFWLSRSYKEQWLLWIAADSFSTVLCLTQGLYWMALLYLLYTISAVYGFFYWKRHGRYLD